MLSQNVRMPLSKIAKQVLLEMFMSGADPLHIINEKGLGQISDTGEIEKAVKETAKKLATVQKNKKISSCRAVFKGHRRPYKN